MTTPYAITAAELRASAENVRDPALAMRMLDRADELERGEIRDRLRAEYLRAVNRQGLMSTAADKAWRALRAETHRQLGRAA